MLEEENRNCDCDCNNETDIPQMDKCPNMERKEMINKIMGYDFSITELALYLDTHPEDKKALCLHKKYCKELKELKDIYQKMYGPLTIKFPCNRWKWLDEPWPWERGNY